MGIVIVQTVLTLLGFHNPLFTIFPLTLPNFRHEQLVYFLGMIIVQKYIKRIRQKIESSRNHQCSKVGLLSFQIPQTTETTLDSRQRNDLVMCTKHSLLKILRRANFAQLNLRLLIFSARHKNKQLIWTWAAEKKTLSLSPFDEFSQLNDIVVFRMISSIVPLRFPNTLILLSWSNEADGFGKLVGQDSPVDWISRNGFM